MRLIDRNEIYRRFFNGRNEVARIHVSDIDIIPDVDAATVVHGKWIDKGWDGDFSWRIDGRGSCWKVMACSACGENLCSSTKTDYCPHCGAKMDLIDGET